MSAGFTPSSEQRDIINHPPEPLRVSAGAGTGKTTTIVLRLAQTVAEGGDPARSLGLTFTNKAADELRVRLRDALPVDPDGREIEVATYHSFASSILDEFGGRIGHRSGLALMDEGHRSELAQRVLRSLESTTLDLTSLGRRRDDVLALSANLTENLMTPQDLRDSAPSDLDETWSTRLELASAAERFAREKRRIGMLEYADLISLACTVVDLHDDVLDEIRARYDTVLLDEYQDTDPAQRLLLSMLFTGGASVTAVGDTDQTIYEWRGASVDNFESFPEDFPANDGPAPTLPLSINRRSGSLILDFANLVRGNLAGSSGSGPLQPQDSAPKGVVRGAWHRTEWDEANWIADSIAESHRQGRALSDIAVLCRKRESLRSIASALRAAGIPFSVGSMGELLVVPEVADLLAWLDILADPSNEPALLRILMGGRYRMGMADIAILAESVGREPKIGLVEALLDDGAIADLSPLGETAIGAFRPMFEQLYQTAQAASVPDTLAAVIDALDYWSEVAALPRAEQTTTRINVSRFIDLTARWRPLDGASTLRSFLRYLRALDESGRADELDAAEVSHDDAVRLLTAHGAKGLEWEEVYLPALSTNIFPSGPRSYNDPLTTATALPYALRLDHRSMRDIDEATDPKERKRLLRIRHEQQEWRLAYVAVTRAREALVLSGHAWHADNKTPKDPSEFLALVQDLDGAELGPWIHEPGNKPQGTLEKIESVSPDPLFANGWDSALRQTVADASHAEAQWPETIEAAMSRKEQLAIQFANLKEPESPAGSERFATSVTNLVALAECPQKFKWIHHDRLPRKPRRSAVLGTEFHRRAELHHLGILSLPADDEPTYDSDSTPDVDAVAPSDPWTSFEATRFHTTTPFLIETPFEITLDGRSIRGKADAVYNQEGAWEIVDYKSGRAPSGGIRDKLVQLQVYALAAADGALAESAPDRLSVTFAYFGTDPAVEITEEADEEWLSSARTRVSSLLAKAEEGPFEATPNSGCRFCDFLHHCEAGKASLRG